MKHTISLFCLLLALAACKKTVEGPPGPQGPQGPPGADGGAAKGNFYGNVEQYDQFGNLYKTGLNTTTVTLVNSTVQAVTDAAGDYTLANVSAGIYDIHVSRPNSGVMKYQQIQFVGNGNIRWDLVSADKATHTLSSATMKDTIQFGNRVVSIKITHTPALEQRIVYAIFGKSANIEATDAKTFETEQHIYLSESTTVTAFSLHFNSSFLENYFNKGETVFIKLFPGSAYEAEYYDQDSKKRVYPSAGTPLAQTLSFKL